nr:vesicle-trafficking protein SEC22c isoform X1 [Chrysemys picta bellii]
MDVFLFSFHSSGDIACMGICTSSCPTVMAFCFLEELQWKFSASYDSTSISLATRSYAFLEFDNIIQKVKYHFNYTSCSQMKNSLEKIQEELKSHPPVLLKLEDTELMNGMINGHTEVQMGSAPTYRMQPVTPLGILSLVLNIMCGALNLIRGVHLAEYSFQEDHEGTGNVIAFLLSFLACIFQIKCSWAMFVANRGVITFTGNALGSGIHLPAAKIKPSATRELDS